MNPPIPGLPQVSPREVKALLRSDLSTFAARCFSELNPATSYMANWHQELIASKLQDCLEGRIRRLILNIPPRNMKSILASVALPAYWLGHRPSDQIICVSYGQALANRHSSDCRRVMGSAWYQKLFLTRMSPQRAAVEEFETTRAGGRMATSVGGVLTGRGADLIILDDPLKPDEAMSDVQREAVNEWYDHTLVSRLNNKEQGCIILVMQRLHLDDLVGHVLEQEGWDVVSLPAIAEEPEDHTFHTFLGQQAVRREPGEPLHAARESLQTLTRLRATMGEYAFSAQYQQAPVPLGGGIVKEAWIQAYDQSPGTFEQVIQSWDTANKDTELSDFSVCTTWGLLKGQMYLLHVLRKRLNYPDLKRAVLEQERLHQATAILIEDRASGTQLIQDLRRDGLNKIHPQNPQGDKAMRLHVQTPWFEGGKILLPKEAHWLLEYRKELTAFPKTRHDDQVDSTTQALAWAAHARGRLEIRVGTSPSRERFHQELDSYMGPSGMPNMAGFL